MRTRGREMYERMMSENWWWQALAVVVGVVFLAIAYARTGAVGGDGLGGPTDDADGDRQQLAESPEDERGGMTEGTSTGAAPASTPDWMALRTRGSDVGSTGTVRPGLISPEADADQAAASSEPSPATTATSTDASTLMSASASPTTPSAPTTTSTSTSATIAPQSSTSRGTVSTATAAPRSPPPTTATTVPVTTVPVADDDDDDGDERPDDWLPPGLVRNA
jgi:hypothetical protein